MSTAHSSNGKPPITEIFKDLRTLLREEAEEAKTLNAIFGPPPVKGERSSDDAEVDDALDEYEYKLVDFDSVTDEDDYIVIVRIRQPLRVRVKDRIAERLRRINEVISANDGCRLPFGWDELLTEHAWANPEKVIRRMESHLVDVQHQSKKDARETAKILIRMAQKIIRQEKATTKFIGLPERRQTASLPPNSSEGTEQNLK